VRWFDRFGGLAMDFVAAAAVAGACMVAVSLDAWVAICIAALQLIAPPLTFSFIGPRAFTLTPRSFAQDIYMLVVMLLLLVETPILEGTVLWLAVAAALLAVALLSSKFTLQHIAFTVPLLTLTGWWTPLLVSLSACAIAAIISRGFFVQQVQGQYHHLEWYWRLNQHYIADRGDWPRLWAAIRAANLPVVASEVLVQNPILVGFVRHTAAFVALALAAVFELHMAEHRAMWLTIVTLAPWVLTSFSAFRVLGAAERYLEYAWPAYWFLLWAAVPTNWQGPALASCAIVFGAYYAANLALIERQMDKYPPAHRDKVLDQIREQGDVAVLPLDAREMTYLLALTPARVVGPFYQQSLRGEGKTYFGWYFRHYPFVSARNLTEIVKRYQPNLVLATTAALKAGEREVSGGYPLDNWEKVAESGMFTLFRRRAEEQLAASSPTERANATDVNS
jgi:hypothetical protein